MANVEKLNNNNNNNSNNQQEEIKKILNPDINDTAYGDNPNSEMKAVRSEVTEQRIKAYRENQKRIQQVIDSRERSVRDYKLELVKRTDSTKGKEEYYIQKSFASIQTMLYPKSAPPTNAKPSYLENANSINDQSITYDLIERIRKKSVVSPYTETTLDRCEETFRTDGVAKRGILKKWDFILGSDMKIVLELTNDYDNKATKRKLIKAIYQYVPYRTSLNEARYILDNVNFKESLYDAGVQSSVYNRGAIEKIRAMNNTIIGLNVLETRFMGSPIYIPINSLSNKPQDDNNPNIIQNEVSYSANPRQRKVRSRNIYWKLFGIEYNDPESILNSNNPNNIEILMMKDLIYIARDNVSVSAGTKGYGLSELEPALDGSETKRIMKTYDFKEIAKSSYSSFGIIKALNSQISKQELQYLVDAMEVNGWCATAHQVEVETYSLTSDARIMIEILDTMNRETGRDLDIPSPLLGYEHIQNYASLQQTLQSWKESVLDADRRRIKELIEKQLLQEILDTSLKRQGFCIKLNERFELQLYELDPTTGQPKEQVILDPNSITAEAANTNAEQKQAELEEMTKQFSKEIEKYGYAFPPRTKGEETTKDPKTGKDIEIDPLVTKLKSVRGLGQSKFIKQPIKPTMLFKDEVTGTIEMLEIPPVKLSFEISDPNFSIFKDKGEIGIQLFDKDAISIEKLLELVDMPDEIDDALKRQAERLEEEKKKNNLMMMDIQNNMNNKSRETDTKVQKMRTEMKAIGAGEKYIGNEGDEEEEAEADNEAFNKKITDKKTKGRY